MENIIYVVIGVVFALLTISIVVVTAFRNAKPTMNNHGTIHNHYYRQKENEESKIIDDEKVLLLAQCLGEVLKTIRNDKESVSRRERRKLSK
jgi:hypothetical protein